MSDELSNATRIAALEADVVRLTAELQGEREDLDEISHSYGDALVEEAMLTRRIEELKEHVRQLTADAAAFNSILKRGQEWMNSAHDSWQRMCNQREEAREALTKALADNATLNTAKDRLIDERNACLRELDAARQELADRNAYAERLLAENVRLTNEAAFMRGFINNEDVRSDYRNVTEMRAALDAARAELEQYRMRLAGALIASEGGDGQPSDALEYLRTCPTITSVAKLRKALTRERSRAEVLEAELRAYREWQRTKCDDNASSLDHWHACKALDEATWNTDRTNALDPAKFGKEPA